MSEERHGDAANISSDAVTERESASPIRLHCLAGDVLPSNMHKDAGRVRKLSDGVLDEMDHVVRACVLQPMTPEIGEQLSRFCQQHEVAEADLGGVLKVCGWLLREASKLDLSTEDLVADATKIWHQHPRVVQTLAEEYGTFKQAYREELLSNALVRHGNVLVDVDWRVDNVTSERTAAKLDASIALVTLAYRDAERSGRLTLQITPDRLARLAQIFGALARKTHLAAAPAAGDDS